MTTDQSGARAGRLRAAGHVLAVVTLGALIVALHARCLDDGLFMDDHAHYRQLRSAGWSLRELTNACRLELFGGIAEAWWMPDVTLRFFRPAAFGLMKLTYTLTGWHPEAMHVASLAWHLAATTLLMLLLRRLGGSPGVAWCTAALFAVHPGHVATVQWIACQTELMVTTLLLGATLCYARFRGWRVSADTRALPTQARRVGWGLAAALLFALALGCRENAIMWPFVLLALEPQLAPRTRRAFGLYGVLAAIAVGYVVVRSYYLGGMALPPRPYVLPAGDPDFVRYVFDKACYYLIGEFLLVPCVPIGGLVYFRDRPLAFYGLAILALALLLFVCVYHRRDRIGRFAVAWLFGFAAPVLPVFESPHHLYLPGIGWAVAAMLLIQTIGGRTPFSTNRVARIRRVLQYVGTVLMGAVFGGVTYFFGLALDSAQRIEDLVAQEIVTAPNGLRSGDTLYIANLPVIAHYVGLAVEERTGLRDLRVRPLTWAPRVLGLVNTDVPTELKWIDHRTIELHIAQDRYFAGPLGRLAAQASGWPQPVQADAPVVNEAVRVELVERDERGIKGLRVIFADDLNAPRIHLFWGSRIRWACEVRPPNGTP